MSDVSLKSFLSVLIEAGVVGILLIIVYALIKVGLGDINYNILLFVSGALFHIICEYTGLNLWYVREYNKLLFNIK